MDLRNLTPHPHLAAVLHDERGREVLVVVIKASFRLSGGALPEGVPHPEPLPVFASDVLFASGAVRYPGDLVPSKEGTDIVCNGHVYAPGDRPVGACVAELRLGEVRGALKVFGRRRWERAKGGGFRPGAPEPFRALPLGMESAFGGRGDRRNPLGRGYFDRELAGRDPLGIELPHLEPEAESDRIQSPEDHPAPAGFAAIAPPWEPRRSLAGTYGERWERERAPLLPEDMSVQFWNAAQLVSHRPLVGGEPIDLVNLTPSGRKVARLPRVPVRFRMDEGEVRPALDLVVLEPDADRMSLTFRVSVDITGRLDGRMPKVRIVEKRCVPLGRRLTQ